MQIRSDRGAGVHARIELHAYHRIDHPELARPTRRFRLIPTYDVLTAQPGHQTVSPKTNADGLFVGDKRHRTTFAYKSTNPGIHAQAKVHPVSPQSTIRGTG